MKILGHEQVLKYGASWLVIEVIQGERTDPPGIIQRFSVAKSKHFAFFITVILPETVNDTHTGPAYFLGQDGMERNDSGKYTYLTSRTLGQSRKF